MIDNGTASTAMRTRSRAGGRIGASARVFRDFVLGLTLFAVVAITGLASGTSGSGLISSSAHARFYEVEPATSELAVAFALGRIPPATARQQVAALSSLALSFATLFAFNLWFWRHVRLVHAKDRRRRG